MPIYQQYDLKSVKIERNVEVPERDSNTSRMRQLIANMEDGDSVLLPIDLINVARLASGQFTDKFKYKEYKDKHGAVTEFRMWKLSRK